MPGMGRLEMVDAEAQPGDSSCQVPQKECKGDYDYTSIVRVAPSERGSHAPEDDGRAFIKRQPHKAAAAAVAIGNPRHRAGPIHLHGQYWRADKSIWVQHHWPIQSRRRG